MNYSLTINQNVILLILMTNKIHIIQNIYMTQQGLY